MRAKDGTFVPRLVQVLRSSRDQTAVATGVDEGEDVVVSGVFLIDSEANLRGALQKMRGNAAQGSASPDAAGASGSAGNAGNVSGAATSAPAGPSGSASPSGGHSHDGK